MKRIKFATPQELEKYCQAEQLSLVVEYLDENQKQRQITLQNEGLTQITELYERPESMSYFKKNGIFYEVVAEWKKK